MTPPSSCTFRQNTHCDLACRKVSRLNNPLRSWCVGLIAIHKAGGRILLGSLCPLCTRLGPATNDCGCRAFRLRLSHGSSRRRGVEAAKYSRGRLWEKHRRRNLPPDPQLYVSLSILWSATQAVCAPCTLIAFP